jgi:hypothetical protein
MTPCGIEAFSKQINKDECDHFRAGPVSYYPTGAGDACPKTLPVRHLAD